MNKKFLMYAAAFAALSGTMVSCSEDDTTGDGIFEMKPLSVTLNATDGDNTTSAAKPNRVHSIVTTDYFTNYWTSDDAVFVWSKEEKFLNKLVGSENTNDKNRMQFSSQACKYQDNKRMALLYVGNQSLTVSNDGEFTLSRGDNDNNLALVYGTGNLHYSDRNNPFVLKVSSSKAANSALSGTNAELTLKDAIAKVRIVLPAKDAEDVTLLKQLKYEITVSYTTANADGDEIGSGFPTSATFKIKNLSNVGANAAMKIFNTDDFSTELGEALKLTYSPDATDAAAKSEVLWNATDADAADYLKGYVYVPIFAGYYTGLSVKVNVTNPKNVDGVGDFCKEYSYTWNSTTDADGQALEIELNSDRTTKYFTLPDMWTRE